MSCGAGDSTFDLAGVRPHMETHRSRETGMQLSLFENYGWPRFIEFVRLVTGDRMLSQAGKGCGSCWS